MILCFHWGSLLAENVVNQDKLEDCPAWSFCMEPQPAFQTFFLKFYCNLNSVQLMCRSCMCSCTKDVVKINLRSPIQQFHPGIMLMIYSPTIKCNIAYQRSSVINAFNSSFIDGEALISYK